MYRRAARCAKTKHPAPSGDGRRGELFRFDCSDGANTRGLRPLGALADLELNFLVLLQGAEAAALNFRVVDEHVRRAVLRGDEAEALLRVEPLHSSLWHFLLFLLFISSGCGPPCFGTPGPFRPLTFAE